MICEWELENSMFRCSEELHYVIILSSYTMGIGKFCTNRYFIHKRRNSDKETVCIARPIITPQTQFLDKVRHKCLLCSAQTYQISAFIRHSKYFTYTYNTVLAAIVLALK